MSAAEHAAAEPQRCEECDGQGWFADHSDECNAKGECVGGQGCPVQRWCEWCRGSGEVS
jgi:hypothetical protein